MEGGLWSRERCVLLAVGRSTRLDYGTVSPAIAGMLASGWNPSEFRMGRRWAYGVDVTVNEGSGML